MFILRISTFSKRTGACLTTETVKLNKLDSVTAYINVDYTLLKNDNITISYTITEL